MTYPIQIVYYMSIKLMVNFAIILPLSAKGNLHQKRYLKKSQKQRVPKRHVATNDDVVTWLDRDVFVIFFSSTVQALISLYDVLMVTIF